MTNNNMRLDFEKLIAEAKEKYHPLLNLPKKHLVIGYVLGDPYYFVESYRDNLVLATHTFFEKLRKLNGEIGDKVIALSVSYPSQKEDIITALKNQNSHAITIMNKYKEIVNKINAQLAEIEKESPKGKHEVYIPFVDIKTANMERRVVDLINKLREEINIPSTEYFSALMDSLNTILKGEIPNKEYILHERKWLKQKKEEKERIEMEQAEEKKAQARKLREIKEAEEKELREIKEAEEKKLAEEKKAKEKELREIKEAEEKKLAEEKKAKEKELREIKEAEEKKLAKEKAEKKMRLETQYKKDIAQINEFKEVINRIEEYYSSAIYERFEDGLRKILLDIKEAIRYRHQHLDLADKLPELIQKIIWYIKDFQYRYPDERSELDKYVEKELERLGDRYKDDKKEIGLALKSHLSDTKKVMAKEFKELLPETTKLVEKIKKIDPNKVEVEKLEEMKTKMVLIGFELFPVPPSITLNIRKTFEDILKEEVPRELLEEEWNKKNREENKSIVRKVFEKITGRR